MSGPAARLLLAMVVAGVAGCGVPPPSEPAGPSLAPSVEPPTTTLPATPQPQQAPLPPPTPTPKPAVDPAVVIEAARMIEPAATIGVMVFDLATRTERLAVEPDRQFRSASLVKLLMAIDALFQGADDRLRERISTMLRHSDDDIASSLWVRGRGAEIVTRTGQALGLTATAPPADPGQWGNVLLSARDVVRIYDYVMTRLPDGDRALIVGSMADAPRFAEDGFDQHFGIPTALPGPWTIKQGWSNSRSDIVTHTSGLVGPNWRYVVVVLTQHPLGVAWKIATKAVTAATRALVPVL